MGADLIIGTISVRTENKDMKEKWKFFVDELEKLKSNIRTGELIRKEWEDYYAEVTGDAEDTPQKDTEIKTDAMNLIDELTEGVKGERRDAVLLIYPERVILVSGGMSWGELPTDLYDTIYKVNSFPLRYFKNTLLD